ncbi:uncharacterized [Tachysurus ichikawai]
MTEGKELDENQTDVMTCFNEIPSWFGHLALCIVLRHHFEAVFWMESLTVAETLSERESRSTSVVCCYQTTGRGQLPIKGTFRFLFSSSGVTSRFARP